MSSAPDIQASLENADEIAELTGRSKSDIIADLLDDGKLNNSNAIKENTSAIDRATEMAGKTHKLLTAIIPILILLAGSGLELGGIIDLTPAGSGDDEWAWEDDEGNMYNEMYWGCTNDAAVNYDPYANVDDGSCEPMIEGCTDPEANNYDEDANSDDESCDYEEPVSNCTGSFYSAEIKLVTTNNTTDMQIYWDADWSCEEEQYIEVDIYIIWTDNQTYYFSNFAGYNITGNESDTKYFTKTNVPTNSSFDVGLTFWVEINDEWRSDDYWEETDIKIP